MEELKQVDEDDSSLSCGSDDDQTEQKPKPAYFKSANIDQAKPSDMLC